ncbi:MAG: hypothetical protein Sylvanvirus14_6 [Sylvanvirus sp.]|uniref:Uncharacterized protein n=1 Tax=Sylvanvirus sp. TaxID=2487774 RepID=A0A3G5AJW3_9VIRU|nr:MAG: hypothetical protein Sylvanvirus14_6 [Sylvanvirus sp.]
MDLSCLITSSVSRDIDNDIFITNKFEERTLNPFVTPLLFSLNLVRYGLVVCGVSKPFPDQDVICCWLEYSPGVSIDAISIDLVSFRQEINSLFQLTKYIIDLDLFEYILT